MDTLAVQQYIQQLIKHDPSEIDTILRMPDGQDEGVWKYEHLRWVLLLKTKRVQLHISRDSFFVVSPIRTKCNFRFIAHFDCNGKLR